jgi:hypothetical protein
MYDPATGWGAHLVGDATRDGRIDLLSYHGSTGSWWLSSPSWSGTFERERRLATCTTTAGWGAHSPRT